MSAAREANGDAEGRRRASVDATAGPGSTARVPPLCAVSSPDGSGCGMLFVFCGVPVVLMPFHVLGCIEHASDTRVVARRTTTSHAALTSETFIELELLPGKMLYHSPCPPPGRAPDNTHLDYVIVACRPNSAAMGPPLDANAPEALVQLLKLPRLEDAIPTARSVVTSKTAKSSPKTEVLLCLAPKSWFQLASEAKRLSTSVVVPSILAPASPAIDVVALRGTVTVPPTGPKWSTLRYDIVTDFGTSGAAVMMSIGSTTEAGTGVTTGRGCSFVLGAMHRAGGHGEHGEGVTIFDISRDIAETMTVNTIRCAAGAGNISPAVQHLLTLSTVCKSDYNAGICPGRYGVRCRAAAEAARAVSERPEEAVTVAAAFDMFTAATTARVHGHPRVDAVEQRDENDVSHGASKIESALCRWLQHYPRSISLTGLACHALGSLSRAGHAQPDFEIGDACLIAALERHADIKPVQSHGVWALRKRLELRLRQHKGKYSIGKGGAAGKVGAASDGVSDTLHKASSNVVDRLRSALEKITAVASVVLLAHPCATARKDGWSSVCQDATRLVELCHNALGWDSCAA